MTPCRHITALRTATAFAVVAALLTLPACAREDPVRPRPTRPEPTIHSLDAKRSIIDLVDASTDALGGEWEVVSGPSRGLCTDATYTEVYGRTWTYGKRRTDDGPRGAARDIPILEETWAEGGLDTTRWQSRGDHPLLRLVGRGAAVSSIGYQDSPFGGGITVSGESACALDDEPGHTETDDPADVEQSPAPPSATAG